MDPDVTVRKLREIDQLSTQLARRAAQLLHQQQAACEQEGRMCMDYARPFDTPSNTDEYGRTLEDPPGSQRSWGILCALCGRRDYDCSWAMYDVVQKRCGVDKLTYDARTTRLHNHFRWHNELINQENPSGN